MFHFAFSFHFEAGISSSSFDTVVLDRVNFALNGEIRRAQTPLQHSSMENGGDPLSQV